MLPQAPAHPASAALRNGHCTSYGYHHWLQLQRVVRPDAAEMADLGLLQPIRMSVMRPTTPKARITVH